MTFPEGGGTQSVFIDRPSDCTVTEAPPPGCTLTSVDPGTTEIRSPILYGVTVTNNCDPPVEAAVAVVDAPPITRRPGTRLGRSRPPPAVRSPGSPLPPLS